MSRSVSHHPTKKGISFPTDICFGDGNKIPHSWDINPNPCYMDHQATVHRPGHHCSHEPIQPAIAVEDGHGAAHVHHERQAFGHGLEKASMAPGLTPDPAPPKKLTGAKRKTNRWLIDVHYSLYYILWLIDS